MSPEGQERGERLLRKLGVLGEGGGITWFAEETGEVLSDQEVRKELAAIIRMGRKTGISVPTFERMMEDHLRTWAEYLREGGAQAVDDARAIVERFEKGL